MNGEIELRVYKNAWEKLIFLSSQLELLSRMLSLEQEAQLLSSETSPHTATNVEVFQADSEAEIIFFAALQYYLLTIGEAINQLKLHRLNEFNFRTVTPTDLAKLILLRHSLAHIDFPPREYISSFFPIILALKAEIVVVVNNPLVDKILEAIVEAQQFGERQFRHHWKEVRREFLLDQLSYDFEEKITSIFIELTSINESLKELVKGLQRKEVHPNLTLLTSFQLSQLKDEYSLWLRYLASVQQHFPWYSCAYAMDKVLIILREEKVSDSKLKDLEFFSRIFDKLLVQLEFLVSKLDNPGIIKDNE